MKLRYRYLSHLRYCMLTAERRTIHCVLLLYVLYYEISFAVCICVLFTFLIFSLLLFVFVLRCLQQKDNCLICFHKTEKNSAKIIRRFYNFILVSFDFFVYLLFFSETIMFIKLWIFALYSNQQYLWPQPARIIFGNYV